MIRSKRQHTIDRAIVRALASCGGYLCPEETLQEQVSLSVTPFPTRSEFDDSLRHVDSERLVIDGDTATGKGWKLTAEGKVWAKENRVA